MVKEEINLPRYLYNCPRKSEEIRGVELQTLAQRISDFLIFDFIQEENARLEEERRTKEKEVCHFKNKHLSSSFKENVVGLDHLL